MRENSTLFISSLSTNSTVVGTVANYYCTTKRHVLVGVPKLNCQKDGTWDADFPQCRLREAGIQPSLKNPSSIAPVQRFPIDRETLLRRPILKEKLPIFNQEQDNSQDVSRPIRRKPFFGAGIPSESNADPRFPIKNEIPDSANVQANQGPRADVPVSSVQNERESRTQQLNLGNFCSLKSLFLLLEKKLIFES